MKIFKIVYFQYTGFPLCNEVICLTKQSLSFAEKLHGPHLKLQLFPTVIIELPSFDMESLDLLLLLFLSKPFDNFRASADVFPEGFPTVIIVFSLEVPTDDFCNPLIFLMAFGDIIVELGFCPIIILETMALLALGLPIGRLIGFADKDFDNVVSLLISIPDLPVFPIFSLVPDKLLG